MSKRETKTEPRSLPFNKEAEQCALGACIIDGEVVTDVTASLKANDFYLKSSQTVFEAIVSLYNEGVPADVVTVTDRLEKSGALIEVGGLDYIVSLAERLPSAANYKYYVDMVRRDSLLRALIRAANDIAGNAYESQNAEESLRHAEKLIFDLSRERDRSSLVNIKTVTTGVIKEIEDLFQHKGTTKAVKTHFSNFDAHFNGGLHRSDLILIAARPGVGKTSLALNIISNIALKGKKRAVVFSLEMPIEQLAKRLLCGVGHVSMSDIGMGNVGADIFRCLHAANKDVTGAEIFVDDSSLNTPADILSKCRRFIKEHGEINVIMIDYLQLMSTGKRTENRQQEISELTRSLKIIAKELNVPILLLSQLSRALETRSEHRPMLSDLRESGAIEQDADIVIFIHKPDMYDPNAERDEVEMIIAKHRNGKTGTIYFQWVGEEVSFRPKLDKIGLLPRGQKAKNGGAGVTLPPGTVQKDNPEPPQETGSMRDRQALDGNPFDEFNESFAEIDAFGDTPPM